MRIVELIREELESGLLAGRTVTKAQVLAIFDAAVCRATLRHLEEVLGNEQDH